MSDTALSRRRLLQAGAVFAGMSAAVAQQAQDFDGGDGAMLPAGGGDGVTGGSSSTATPTPTPSGLSVYGDGTYGDGTYNYS